MATILRREITDGQQVQGVDEKIYYQLITTPWGGSPAAPVITGFKKDASGAWVDVTATIFPINTPSVSGDNLVLPRLEGLVEGGEYRIEMRWTHPGGSLIEAYALLSGQR